MDATQIKEQKLIGSSDYGLFKDQVNQYLSSGWKVVPGTLTVALTPSGEKMVAKERYFAVADDLYITINDQKVFSYQPPT